MVLVISDSKMKAGDNGEYFYEYVMNNHNDELYFIISNKSSDYDRLINKGFNVVDVNDMRMDDIFEKADYILYSKEQYPLSQPRCRKYVNKRVFLQHGVTTKMSLSPQSWDKHNRFSKFICSASEGEKALLENYLGVNMSTPVVTGFARWDSLRRKNDEREKHSAPHILITFHWRAGKMNHDLNTFLKSEYLENVNALLNSDELKELSSKCEITFMHHAQFAKYKNYFKVPPYIKYGTNLQFQDMLVDADLLITDISSNAYEMAVIGKPTFYYIPDMEYVKKNMTNYKIGNLKKNSIGKYCDDFNELILSINQFVNGEFELSEANKKNIIDTLGEMDSNNCSRIYYMLFDNLNNPNNGKSENKQSEHIVHTGGIWNKAMKMKAMVDEGSKKRIKVGDKFIFV